MDLIAAICKKYDVKEEQILKHRFEDDDQVIIVLDMGIKGCPQYTVPLEQLKFEDEQFVTEELPKKVSKPRRKRVVKQ